MTEINFFFSDNEGDTALAPIRAHEGDAGWDLKCKWVDGKTQGNTDWIIHPGEIAKIHTGVGFVIPDGWYGKIFGRSSLEIQGILSVGGVIDSPYRGEVLVGLLNLTGSEIVISRGQRVAQIVFMPCSTKSLSQILKKDISQTKRGENGFGSSDRKSEGETL